MERTSDRCTPHFWDRYDTFTASDTRPCPPSLILFSLDRMRRTLLLFVAAALAAAGCATQPQPHMASNWKFMLLSWKFADGHWYYSLRPNGTEEVSAKTDAQHRFSSLAALKRRLAELTPGTHINWSKYRAIGFDYPPEGVIVDLQRFAQRHGLYMYSNFVMEE
jgi:hypothetical protein